MSQRYSQELIPNIYDKGPSNPQWTQKQENIEQMLQKIKIRNLSKKMHNISNEQQENDRFLIRSQRLNKKLEEFDQFHEEQLESYRKILQSDREQLSNAIYQRKRQGSFIKHVRSISTAVLRPLIQINNLVNSNQTERKLQSQAISRKQIKSIQENRKTLEECSKRLCKLFKDENPSRAPTLQSSLESRTRKKKMSIDFIRNLY